MLPSDVLRKVKFNREFKRGLAARAAAMGETVLSGEFNQQKRFERLVETIRSLPGHESDLDRAGVGTENSTVKFTDPEDAENQFSVTFSLTMLNGERLESASGVSRIAASWGERDGSLGTESVDFIDLSSHIAKKRELVELALRGLEDAATGTYNYINGSGEIE